MKKKVIKYLVEKKGWDKKEIDWFQDTLIEHVIEATKQVLLLGVVSVSLPDIQDAAKQALERTKLPKNSPTTERELMLGERAFINGGIWVKNKYDGNER